MPLRLVPDLRPSDPATSASATPRYAELHARSAFSLLDGASHPEALADRAAALGLHALALVDRDDLGSAVRFATAAAAADLRPIHGATITLDDGSGLPLLVRDRTGWANLCRLVTAARMDAERGAPRTPLDRLAAHAAGLIALTGGLDGPLPRALAPNARTSQPAPRARLAALRDIFGDGLYVEVSRHGLAWEDWLTERLLGLAGDLDLPWVPTQDVRYATPADRVAYDVMVCLRHRTLLDDAGTLLLPSDAWHLRSPAAMARLWHDHPAALARTVEVADRCTFDVRALTPTLPRFSPGGPAEDVARLRELVDRGAAVRYGPTLPAAHRRQLDHELAVIGKLGFAGYFLIVHDIVAFARRRGTLVQGRGSAANSAVCYCLGITAVDPIGMDLLFERFLSEGRTDPPDIDVDISHMEREDVLQYVYERYGRHHAAMVCTSITWRGRSAVRDVARVLGFDTDAGARLALQVGHAEAADAARLLADGGAAAAGLDPAEPRVATLLDVVARLDRTPRHRSIHTGGFVLTRERLDTIVPIEPASMDGRTVIQWDKDDLPPVGLVKIDLLGLGILTVLQRCTAAIREGRGVDIDLALLPMDDAAVYAEIARADTIGVFQLESRAQMNVLPRLRPERFYDLVVQVALIRPGPIQGQMVHPYIRRRRGEEPVTFLHPALRPALARTLGVPLFQEQGMKVAIAMAGFTAEQADRLRKAMGFKRATDHLDRLIRELYDGMRARGVDDDTAFRIVNQLEGFSNYGFPESHAASFALLAYASAWLRHHYGPEFTASILNAQPMGFYSPSTLVHDARRRGVVIRPVDLLHSRWDATLEHDVSPPAVRIGLRLVRGLSAAAREQLEVAAASGPLSSLDDLIFRTTLDDGALVALARAGAFRSMWPGRREALWELLRRLRERRSPLPLRQPAERRVRLPSLTLLEEVRADYATVGLSHHAHPMAFHRDDLDRRRVVPSRDLRRHRDGAAIIVAGLVTCRQRPGSAKGVFFMTLEDEHGMTNVVVMPDVFDRDRLLLASAPALVVHGRLEHQQGVLNVLGHRFEALSAQVRHRARSFR